MSNASLKEQLLAVASQFRDEQPKSTLTRQQAATTTTKRGVGNANAKQNAGAPKKPLKPRWLDYAHYGVELLKAYYPKAFTSLNNMKPLKKGIKQDLVKHLSTLDKIVTEDKACMVKSLSYYVNTLSYLKCVTPGSMRVDLDGQPVETVTPEEATYSIERHQTKINAKKRVKTVSPPQKKEESTSAN